MNFLGSKASGRHCVLNFRAAALIAVTFLAFLFGMKKLHDRQFGKSVIFLRQSAYASLEAKDYHNAQIQLNQYLVFRSSDLDAREKLSSLLSKHIRTRPALEQAFRLNEELLRHDLPQTELRLEQARIAVELGRFSDAQAHLQILQTLWEESAEVWYLSGHCARTGRRTEDAARCYQRALACSDPPERAFDELATLATAHLHLMLDADSILDQMVLSCNTVEARRLRALHLIEAKRFSQALPHVWQGLLAAPDDVTLNAILVHCLQSDDVSGKPQTTQPANFNDADLPRAIRQLQGCVERNPQQTSFRVHLAALLWKNQQPAAATGILEAGIIRDSQAFPLHSALLEYLLMQEQTEKAERLFRSLPATALPKAELELLSGRVQSLRRDWKNADVSLRRAVAWSEPGSALQHRAQMLLAVCRSNSGDATTAVDAFRTVLAAAPESVAGRLGLASAWITAGRKDMAIAEYRQLMEVPGVPAVLADLLIQRNLEQPAGLRNWNEVAELVRDRNPLITDSTQRTLLRTDLLMASGRMSEAIAVLESASTANPANSAFQRALAKMNGEQSGELQNRLQQSAIERAAALQRIKSIDTTTDPSIKARALLAFVQYASPRQGVLPVVMQELVAMINAAPDSTALRICYADVLLYGGHMETATQVLEQIQSAPPDDGEVSARQAWILAVEGCSPEKAADLIAHAIQMQPGNPAFRVMQGRVLLAGDRYADVLSTLSGIDEQHHSQAALTYKAAALLEMEELDQAWRIVEELRLHKHCDPMFPADELLLQTVLNRLNQFTTATRTQP